MTLVWKSGYSFDSDASTYIDAVETADGQALETGVRVAINDFVLGCKQDGIWNAIKASCILAGARTLDGALVPLVGTAPTNNNFVSGDYNRETGLVGDGSTKYLDSNRNSNADPQNNKHVSIYQTHPNTLSRAMLGARNLSPLNTTQINSTSTRQWAIQVRNANPDQFTGDSTAVPQFAGGTRNSSSSETRRNNQTNTTYSNTSLTPPSLNLFIFANNQAGTAAGFSDTARLAFYSIGESLDLAALDTRVSNLMTAIGAAIP